MFEVWAHNPLHADWSVQGTSCFAETVRDLPRVVNQDLQPRTQQVMCPPRKPPPMFLRTPGHERGTS